METIDGGGVTKPLSGIRVLAVEHYRAGPTTSLLLADAGAEVIKIEPPGTGEAGRGLVVKDRQGQNVSIVIASLSRNKKSVTLNLASEKGKELFKQLVKRSDVVLENMRAGVMDRLGLGYSELKTVNPRIIYTSVSGYGHLDIYQSPYWDWQAMDPLAQAMSGFMYTAGGEADPPIYNVSLLADTVPAMLAAFGILTAIIHRNRTGLGQHVDISMYDCMVFLNNYRVIIASLTGTNVPRKLLSSSPLGAFKAKDGYFAIAVVGELIWQRFCKAIGREDLVTLPELKDGDRRAQNEEKSLWPVIEEWAASKSVEEVCRILRDSGVPSAPVQDEMTLLNCPHLKARRMLVEIETSPGAKATVAGNPVKLSAVPEKEPSPPPFLGQHNLEVLGGLLGFNEEQIRSLRKEGII